MNKMKNKFQCFETQLGDCQFKIEEDLPDVGWYLKVFKNGSCVADHLQDSLDLVKEQAFEDYGVPLKSWEQTESEGQ